MQISNNINKSYMQEADKEAFPGVFRDFLVDYVKITCKWVKITLLKTVSTLFSEKLSSIQALILKFLAENIFNLRFSTFSGGKIFLGKIFMVVLGGFLCKMIHNLVLHF